MEGFPVARRVALESGTTPISNSLFNIYDWSLGISANTSSKCSRGDLGSESAASVSVVSLYLFGGVRNDFKLETKNEEED